MANEFRALVIHQGVQKRIPDEQALDVGSIGIVAMDDDVVQKLQIGSADNKLLADGSDPASNHIEFLGGAKFNSDVLIQGELRVVGDTITAETMVTQTIFEQSVQFGDQYASDSAVFRSAIDADARHVELTAVGGLASNRVLSEVLTAEVVGTVQDLPAGGDAGVLYFAEREGTYHMYNEGTSAWALATEEEKGQFRSFLQMEGDDGEVQLKSRALLDVEGNSIDIDSDTTLEIDSKASSHLIMTADNADARVLAIKALNNGAGEGQLQLDAQGASHFKTSVGNLALDSEAADLLLDAGSDILAQADAGYIQLKSGSPTSVVPVSSAGDVILHAKTNILEHADQSIVSRAGADLLGSAAAGVVELAAHAGATLATGITDPLTQGQIWLSSVDKFTGLSGAELELQGTESSHFKVVSSSADAQNLTLQASNAGAGDASISMSAKSDVLAEATNGYFQLKAGAPTNSLPPDADGDIRLHAANDLRAVVDNAIALEAQHASKFEALGATGSLNLRAAQKQLAVWTGDTLAYPATIGAVNDKDVVLSADKNLLMRSANNAYVQSVGLMDIDVDKDLKIVSGAAADGTSPSLSMQSVGGLMKFDADQSMEMDIEGDLTITVDPRDPTVDGSAIEGNISITATYVNGAKTQSGGQFDIVAGNDDNGHFFVAAGSRDVAGWQAGADATGAGQIQLRSQMAMRLRSGDDMRLEVGGTNHVILGDGSFDENNELGHAKIRNVKDPTHAQDVVTKKYMEENGGGTVKLIAFEALAKGDLVALEAAGGKVQKADAASNDYLFGIATHAADADGEILVRMLGKFDLGSPHSGTPGTPFYMGADGARVATAPTEEGSSVQRAGLFLAGNEVLMLIGEPVIL